MKYFILIVSVLFTALVLYDVAMWIILSSQVSSLEEATNLHLIRYPQFMGSAIKITLVNILLSLLAGSGFVIIKDAGTKMPPSSLKILTVLAFVLAAWHIFSLM